MNVFFPYGLSHCRQNHFKEPGETRLKQQITSGFFIYFFLNWETKRGCKPNFPSSLYKSLLEHTSKRSCPRSQAWYLLSLCREMKSPRPSPRVSPCSSAPACEPAAAGASLSAGLLTHLGNQLRQSKIDGKLEQASFSRLWEERDAPLRAPRAVASSYSALNMK